MKNTIYYFAYGSNLQAEQMEQRRIFFHSRDHAILPGHRVVFNKKSILYPGFAAANIEEDADSLIEGILYSLTRDALQDLSQFEIGYEIVGKEVCINGNNNRSRVAHIFVAKKSFIINGLPVSEQYAERIISGGTGVWTDKYKNALWKQLKLLVKKGES